MGTLSIEAATPDSARGLCTALESFGAELDERPTGPVVQVALTGRRDEIVAVLHTIQEYVTSRPSGTTRIGLDGRTYLLDAYA